MALVLCFFSDTTLGIPTDSIIFLIVTLGNIFYLAIIIIMLSVIKLNVFMPSVIQLSVVNVIIVSVVMLKVVAPLSRSSLAELET